MAWDLVILVYFVTVNTIYLLFTLVAYASCAVTAAGGRAAASRR